jgi:hypothetical protein
MKKRIYFVGVLLLSIGSFTACKNQETSSDESSVVVEIADDPETEKANKQALADLKKQQEEERNSQTSMGLDKMTHDFGPVKEGSDNHCTFTVTNTGDKPLIIQDVKASCGCTTPVKPEKPIAPGKSDKIEVGFKPSGKGDIEKTVTITANTEPVLTVVKVKAFVN